MSIVTAVFALVAATAVQTQVPAADGSEMLDAQCLTITSGAGAALPEGAQREALQMASMFFHGRLSARVPSERLETLLWEQGRLINASNQQPLLSRCSSMMTESGTMLRNVGRRIAERERGSAPR